MFRSQTLKQEIQSFVKMFRTGYQFKNLFPAILQVCSDSEQLQAKIS